MEILIQLLEQSLPTSKTIIKNISKISEIIDYKFDFFFYDKNHQIFQVRLGQ